MAVLPGTVQDAARGRGPIGRIIDRLGLVGYVQDHESELQDAAENLTVVVFVLYQQLENYVIYPEVMARTVKVNPLVVLLSLLVGAQLFGIVGAVLAVPASGAVQVALRAVRRELNHGGLVLPGSLEEET